MRLRVTVVTALILGLVAVADRAPAAPATIHPGVSTSTVDAEGDGAQCTANFVFSDGTDLYLGQAAHCAGLGAPTDTNGCKVQSLPLGTKVLVEGARHPGRLVYSSWIAMQRAGERDPNACEYNDFALVRLDRRDRASVSPTMPFWGGPSRLGQGAEPGGKVFSYQNSGLRAGISALSPKEGYSLGTGAGGWVHTVYTVTPGIPGDSGSGVVDSRGAAFGVTVHIHYTPVTGSNGVTDLRKALAYMRSHGGPQASLVTSRVPFRDGGVLP